MSTSSHLDQLRLWRKLSLFGAIPVVILISLKTAYEVKYDHRMHQRPEFVPYEYLRIRNKRFPWGDGQKTLFHNPKRNALPTGYEE